MIRTMTRFYLCTALLVAIVATLSSPSTVAMALEATDAGDEFLADLDQVEEDSGKKPRRDRELNHWWHHDDYTPYYRPPTKRPTKRPTKKPTKKPGYWGW